MDNLLLNRSSPIRTSPIRSDRLNSGRARDMQRNILNNIFTSVIRRGDLSNENIDGILLRDSENHSVRILYDVLRSNIQISEQNSVENQLLIDKY